MLVATGLVVMIMLMFAQIYGTAISTISEQRGMGNNDQKARILSSILHNDLKNITYRQTSPEHGSAAGIVPLVTGDETIIDLENQLGYFYLSENDPLDPTDDVLQFTAKVPDNDFDNWYIGKAADLGTFENQPSKDGGPPNARGQSRYAEISYFLRKGTLYRRVLLLRDTTQDEQPGNGVTDRYFGAPPKLDMYSNFWRDFDYSATRFYDEVNGVSFPWFHGRSSLLNRSATSDRQPLGLPWNRFGHFNHYPTSPEGILRGLPREYTSEDPDNQNSVFFGRFTHEETETGTIAYPGEEDTAGFFRRGLNLPWDNSTNTVVSGLPSPVRLGEDVLLTNVESFDIEVWEPEIKRSEILKSATSGRFVQLGYTLDLDDPNYDPNKVYPFSEINRTNANYGPRIQQDEDGVYQNNIFDTWHPDVKSSSLTPGDDGQAFAPPYRPVRSNAPPIVNMANRNTDGEFVGGYADWNGSVQYSVGNRIRIRGLQTPQTDLGKENYNDSLLYEVIAVNGNPTPGVPGNPGAIPPVFSAIPNMIVEDGQLTWKCIDNRIGLQSIRITIRYIDLQSRLPRQVTVVHSFMKSRPK